MTARLRIAMWGTMLSPLCGCVQVPPPSAGLPCNAAVRAEIAATFARVRQAVQAKGGDVAQLEQEVRSRGCIDRLGYLRDRFRSGG